MQDAEGLKGETLGMDFSEKAKVRIEHWVTHNEHHQEEYEAFAAQLEEAGKQESALKVREVGDLTARSTECLREALKSLESA